MTEPERIQLDALRAEVRALTAAVDKLSIKFDYQTKQSQDHEERLRSVERWKLSIPISVLLAFATVIGAVVTGGRF